MVSGDINWSDARDAANNQSLFGLQGYLTTVTSSGEHDFVTNDVANGEFYWMGGTDRRAQISDDESGAFRYQDDNQDSAESEWHWVTGPEGMEDNDGDGVVDSDGFGSKFDDDDTDANDDPLDINYQNWSGVQPDGDDCAHYSDYSGLNAWNDDNDVDGNSPVPHDNYVIEYGGMPNDPSLNVSDSRTVRVDNAASGPGVSMDGSDAHVDMGDVDAMDGTASFTLETWVKLDTLEAGDTILNKQTSSDQTAAIKVADASGTLSVTAANGTATTGTGAVGTNQGWQHIALSYDGSASDNAGRLQLYVDGTQQSLSFGNNVDASTSADVASRLVAGGEYTATSADQGATNAVEGSMTDVRVWDTARTQTEIQDNRDARLDGTQADLAGNWRLDDGQGDTADEATGTAGAGDVEGTGWQWGDANSIDIASGETYKGMILGDQAQSYSVNTSPSNGTLTLDGNEFTYDHDGSSLPDQFKIDVTDQSGTTQTQTVEVT